jgi:hypothetical protein
MLPNEQLSADLLHHSNRWIAANYDIGKTTVGKHRNKCTGVYIPKATEKAMLNEELQSINWTGDKGVWNTGLLDSALEGVSHDSILSQFGYDPNTVAIRGVIRESHKEYWSRDLEQMLWKHSYSFAVERKTQSIVEDIDPVEILKSLRSESIPNLYNKTGGVESTFVLDWADWQYAKMEMGGTQGLIERLNDSFNLAVQRIQELRMIGRNLEELVIIGGGDMVEGCVIYPNQSYEIDGNRREQVRGVATMILEGITKLAPHFESVRVVVAPGNHGEHRIAGNRTTIGDNDDLLVFEIAEMACNVHPDLQHVKFEIAEKEISVTTKIFDWTYGVTHGDIYGKTGGTGIRNKVFNWFKTMAANRHPIGQSDVLVTHHFHHDALEDWGMTIWVQNPTMDGGSHYFKEATGHDTRPGMNSWVVTESERLQDKQVLRKNWS